MSDTANQLIEIARLVIGPVRPVETLLDRVRETVELLRCAVRRDGLTLLGMVEAVVIDERDSAASRAERERHTRKAAERECDTHRQHAIEMEAEADRLRVAYDSDPRTVHLMGVVKRVEGERDAANERAERAERLLAAANDSATETDEILDRLRALVESGRRVTTKDVRDALTLGATHD